MKTRDGRRRSNCIFFVLSPPSSQQCQGQGNKKKNPFPRRYYYYGPEASKGRSRKSRYITKEKGGGSWKQRISDIHQEKMVWLLPLWGAAAIEEGKKGFFCPVSQKSATTTLLYPHFLSLSRIFFTASLHITILLLHLAPAKREKKFWGSGARGWKKTAQITPKKYRGGVARG